LRNADSPASAAHAGCSGSGQRTASNPQPSPPPCPTCSPAASTPSAGDRRDGSADIGRSRASSKLDIARALGVPTMGPSAQNYRRVDTGRRHQSTVHS
jgi:hypothetical protein